MTAPEPEAEMHTSSTNDAHVTTDRTGAGGLGSFTGAVVQVLGDDPTAPRVGIETLHAATIVVTAERVVATDGTFDWQWDAADLEEVIHGAEEPWTVLVVPGIGDFGVTVEPGEAERFRAALAHLPGVAHRTQRTVDTLPAGAPVSETPAPTDVPAAEQRIEVQDEDRPTAELAVLAAPARNIASAPTAPIAAPVAERRRGGLFRRREVHSVAELTSPRVELGAVAALDARNISAWFGTHQVLDRVSLLMPAGKVTALIGPSGCGKSTFLRILNRMHEMIPSASMGGEVMLDGHDVYDPSRKLTDARREIGMVFQKPNPFPAMSIYDNVIASLRVTGVKATTAVKDDLVESCLSKAGLWNEVKDRLRQPGGGLSGGQQQRLCIARALAIKPRVLLMDEPCSALDPTSTRRIEQTIMELAAELTIVIVTHNMQQAARVSDRCAFFLAEHGTPGVIVEHGPTDLMFESPQDPRTNDYVNGRFG
jgi:phosphate transport system ATP-binding protein